MKKIVVRYLVVIACICASNQLFAQNAYDSGTKNARDSYKELLATEANIKAEMQYLSENLSSMSRSKAKKASKRLVELNELNESIQKRKTYFPQSVVNGESSDKIDPQAREDIKKIVDERVLERGGSLETDISYEQDEEGGWSVVIAISTSADISKYRSYGDVSVERMGDRYIFFIGPYYNKSEADAKCKQIIKKGKFRDAFVVRRGE